MRIKSLRGDLDPTLLAMGDVVLQGGDVVLQGEREDGTEIGESTRCRREVGGRE